MSDRNKEVRQLLDRTLLDLSDEQFSIASLSEGAAAALIHVVDALVVQEAMQVLPGGFSGRGTIVSCAMPNNPDTPPKSAALQCQSCNEYFCKKHSLGKCPLCGGSLR